MIPIKIQIKNFLSYGNELQTIDFSPYHLLCLSGKNGHGKSALLDAITWAIWGQARKTSNTAKADHGLLRLGQTHMLVILDFECNSTQYRIRREFALTYGKPYAALDFGIIDEAQDTILPFTEKTIRGTQQKIEDTLHLDYDAFVNSAFLRQGQSNEFSKKSAKDRKEILANILGLQRYEELRKTAHDTSRDATVQKQQLIALQENAAREIEKTDEIQHKLRATDQQLALHTQKEEELKAALQTLQAEQSKLSQQLEAKKRIEKDCADLLATQQTAQKELRALVKEWRSVHANQLHASSGESLKKEHTILTAALHSHQEMLAKKLEKKELYLKEKEITAHIIQTVKNAHLASVHKASLELEQTRLMHKQHEQQATTLTKQEQQLSNAVNAVQKEIADLAAAVSSYTIKDIASIEQQFEKRRMHYQQWIAQANCIKEELDQLQQKKQFTQDDIASSCPLCEQNLSASRKKFLKDRLEKQELFSAHRYRRLSRLIGAIKPLLVTQHEHVTALKKALADLQIMEHKKRESEKKAADLQQELNMCKTAQSTLLQQIDSVKKLIAEQEKRHTELLESVEQHIDKDPACRQQQGLLQQAEKEYAAVIYDAPSHQKCVQQLSEITVKLNAFEKLEADVQKQQERQRAIANSCAMLKKMRLNLQALQAELAACRSIEEDIERHTKREREMQQQLNVHTAEKNMLLQEKGKYTQHLSMLATLKEEHAKQGIEIKKLTESIDDYQAIATALGKNGIQALLIEDAIPEIEHEANDLLGKLTDNQAHISIESLRDLKSGGTRETLDINISDAAGIRAYELFSGGEAFRIDFALRIAISKLLARRAGTSLQTLIIDEGFGSQDDDGLSYIMDAIYKIQDDFKKVIIVSHLPRMKDQFPVHFYVQKGPAGSTVNIIEQA